MVRQPAVAGSFYPSDPEQLHRDLIRLMPEHEGPEPALGLIVPHAGYVYSGAVAGEVIAGTQIPPRVVLLGPNHQGAGPVAAVSRASAWETPLGQVPVDADLRLRLLQGVNLFQEDDSAHLYEHSLEVMLPFLRQVQPELEIVPISLRSLGLAECLGMAHQLAEALKDWPEPVLLLASSDMNHFRDAEITRQLDSLAIDAMTDFDPPQLYETVMANRISMCGVLPAVIVLQAAGDLGATRCQLVRYAHSGMVNQDNQRVVGYAGLRIS